MGYIIFQSLKEDHSILANDMLETSEEISDELSSFMPGDVFTLSLEIDRFLASLYISSKSPGITIRERLSPLDDKLGQIAAEIDFKVVERSHLVSRDWMMKYNMGFRSSGTTIVVEAISDEAEALFIQLQEKFNTQLDKWLGIE